MYKLLWKKCKAAGWEWRPVSSSAVQTGCMKQLRVLGTDKVFLLSSQTYGRGTCIAWSLRSVMVNRNKIHIMTRMYFIYKMYWTSSITLLTEALLSDLRKMVQAACATLKMILRDTERLRQSNMPLGYAYGSLRL